MAESLIVSEAGKEEKYRALLPQLDSLASGEPDLIANLANTAAALRETFGFFWVGFYLVKGDSLVLGPFQGPVACTRISRGRGVCGTAWERRESILVPDVAAFPGHISCNAASRSEVVVPVIKNGEVRMILDVDSDRLNDFDETDREYLHRICDLIAGWIS